MIFQFTLTRVRDDEKGVIHTDTKVFNKLSDLQYFLNCLSADAVTPDEALDVNIKRSIADKKL